MSWNMNGAQRIAESNIAEKFAAEETIARYVADLLGLDLVSFPRYSIVDRLLVMEGLASAFIEVKTRTTARVKYPTYRISKEKLIGLRCLAQDTHVPVLLIVEWGCGAIGSANVLDGVWSFAGTHGELPIERFTKLRRPA